MLQVKSNLHTWDNTIPPLPTLERDISSNLILPAADPGSFLIQIVLSAPSVSPFFLFSFLPLPSLSLSLSLFFGANFTGGARVPRSGP